MGESIQQNGVANNFHFQKLEEFQYWELTYEKICFPHQNFLSMGENYYFVHG